MEEFMERLKKKVTVGLVGGSDLAKILEQLGNQNGLYFSNYVNFKLNFLIKALQNYDYVFSENGLVTHKNGELIFQEVCKDNFFVQVVIFFLEHLQIYRRRKASEIYKLLSVLFIGVMVAV